MPVSGGSAPNTNANYTLAVSSSSLTLKKGPGGGQKEYIDKLQKLQNTAYGRILGAFRTSLATPMELRASLPLPIRLQEIYRKSALQTVTLPDRPIQLRTSSTFPSEYHSRINVEHNIGKISKTRRTLNSGESTTLLPT